MITSKDARIIAPGSMRVASDTVLAASDAMMSVKSNRI